MSTPEKLTIGNWNQLIQTLSKESDRGAAILAASFVENYLGNFLKSKTRDDDVAKMLFGQLGPLSSFYQRIAVAYTFNFIDRWLYDDLTTIRGVRNHFAHHPFDASFSDLKVQKAVSTLTSFPHFGTTYSNDSRLRHRIPYLEACAMSCGALQITMGNTATASEGNDNG